MLHVKNEHYTVISIKPYALFMKFYNDDANCIKWPFILLLYFTSPPYKLIVMLWIAKLKDNVTDHLKVFLLSKCPIFCSSTSIQLTTGSVQVPHFL